MKAITLILTGMLLPVLSCTSQENKNSGTSAVKDILGNPVSLVAPYATKSATNFCEVIGWPEGKTPIAPSGFKVSKFAAELHNPRWIYTAENGDVFVAEVTNEMHGLKKIGAKIIGAAASEDVNASPDKIILLRDTDGDGIAEFKQEFITEGLNQPFGMLIKGNLFYVANTDGIVTYPYTPGQTSITGPGKKILDLPADKQQRHYSRNIILSKDERKILIMVGSYSNAGEKGLDKEIRRANILEVNLDGSGEKLFASGLRNPVGAAYAPGTNTLYTAVNERDELGDELVPDYLTSVKKGGFYGWPYCYWGAHKDPRLEDKQRPDLVAKAIVPDLSLGSHTASLGLAFDSKNTFPGQYKGAAFIGQHGSWNRAVLSGYKVAYVPFKNGKPSGEIQDFLTGFIADLDKQKVYGRPVGTCFTKKGALLVADDAGNAIWQVTPNKD